MKENTRPNIKIKKQEIILRKASVEPNFTNKTVLTDSTWRYIELFLKKEKKAVKNDTALNYWKQAENFYEATKNLDILSKPLTSYYCFLNATKALLTYKGINFDTKHGVSGEIKNGQIVIQNEYIKLHPKGVLSGLCNYLNEPVKTIGDKPETYNLKEILYNLEYIHRAYILTFGQAELFVPVSNPRFVFDKIKKEGWLETQLEEQYSNQREFTKFKTGFSIDWLYSQNGLYTIRLNKKFEWEAPRNKPTDKSLKSFKNYYKNQRKRFRYIYSPNQLWYIKRKDLQGIIDRNTLSLTFAAMHCLSEMSRYDPDRLAKHLEKSCGWLLTEFINKSIYQFIDMISSEISGDDFRVTGFRT